MQKIKNYLFLLFVSTFFLLSCLRFDLTHIETEPNCDLSQKSCKGLLPDGETVELELSSKKPALMGSPLSFRIFSNSNHLKFLSLKFSGAEMDMGEINSSVIDFNSQVTLATCLEESMIWKVTLRGENLLKKEKFGLVFRFRAIKDKSQQLSGSVTTIHGTPPAFDFELPSSSGKIRLSDFSNKVRLIYFGFTTCPDICPTTLSNVKNALKKLGPDEKKQVKLLFVTVDPERDNLKKLQEYLNFFDKDFVPLVGSIKQIEATAKAYGAFFKKVPLNSAMKYTMDHSASLFIVGKSGLYEGVVVGHVSSDELANILKLEIQKERK